MENCNGEMVTLQTMEKQQKSDELRRKQKEITTRLVLSLGQLI